MTPLTPAGQALVDGTAEERLRALFTPYFDDAHDDADGDAEWCMKHLPSPQQVRAALAAEPVPVPEDVERPDWPMASPLTCQHGGGWERDGFDCTWCALCGRWRDDIMAEAALATPPEPEP
jgi:hypothetical protein